MLEEVRRGYGGKLENALFGIPGARTGRNCKPVLSQFEKAYKLGSLTESEVSYFTERNRVQQGRQDYLAKHPGEKFSVDSPFCLKKCGKCEEFVVRGDVVYTKGAGDSAIGTIYQFWSRSQFISRQANRICGECKLKVLSKRLPTIVPKGGEAQEGVVPAAGVDQDKGKGTSNPFDTAAVAARAAHAAALRRDGAAGGASQSKHGEGGSSADETVDDVTSIDQRGLALDSMSPNGDGLTSEVADVLALMGQLELASLCRKAIEGKHKPASSLTLRVTDVLRASLPKMVDDAILISNGSHPLQKENASVGKDPAPPVTDTLDTVSEKGNEDRRSSDRDSLITGTQGDDSAGVHKDTVTPHGTVWGDVFGLGERGFEDLGKEVGSLESRGYPSELVAAVDSDGYYPERCSLVPVEFNFLVEGIAAADIHEFVGKGYKAFGSPPGYVAATAYFRPNPPKEGYRVARVYFTVVLPNMSTADCFYEGDVCETNRCACGYGSLVVMPGREVYSGFFTSLHRSDVDDTPEWVGRCVQDQDALGCEEGKSITDIVAAFCHHRKAWFRVWFPIRAAESDDLYVLECRMYNGKRSKSVSTLYREKWQPLKVHGGSFLVRTPPISVLERLHDIVRQDRAVDADPVGFHRRWRGHLSLRPQSVVDCEADPLAKGTRFSHVSLWHSGESGYELYDTIVVAPVFAEATSRRRRVDTLKRKVFIGTHDVTGGVTFLPDGTTAALSDLMMLQNVRAIMCVPALHKRSRLHGKHKFTTCRVFYQAADVPGDPRSKYSEMMRGLPVQVADDYAETHFPCHWRLAKCQPNTVVLIEPVCERFPPRVHGQCQLLHLLLLKDLMCEDKGRRVKGTGGEVSVVLPLADHVFGMHGLALQIELLYPLTMEEENCTPPDRATDDVTHANLVQRGVASYEEWNVKFSRETFDGFDFILPQPRLGDASGLEVPPLTLGANRRMLLYDSRSKKLRKVTNLKRVKFVPRSPTAPFHLELVTDSGPKTRSGPRGARASSGLALVSVGVTVSWMLNHFHREVVLMAMDGRWRSCCFSEDSDPADPYAPAWPVYNPTAKGKTVTWKHNSYLDIGKVGHTLGSHLASCVGNAVTEIILQDASWHGSLKVDMGAVRMVENWAHWMDWSSVPGLLQALNTESDAGRTYKAKEVPVSNGGSLDTGGYDSLLLTSSLGRQRLFDAGVHAMLVQPVDRKTGWARHAVGYVADNEGVWSMHDQDDAPFVLEEGPSPGTSGILAAWTVDVRASTRGLGPPAKKKQVVRKQSGKFQFPTSPTMVEAGAHAVRLSVLDAFKEHLSNFDRAGTFEAVSGELCLSSFTDEEAYRQPCRLWEKLTESFIVDEGFQAPVKYHSVMYESLWDPQQRQDIPSDFHLLLARSDAAEWCPETVFIMRCRDRHWEVFNPTQRAYQRVFKTKKPLGYLLVSSVVRLGMEQPSAGN